MFKKYSKGIYCFSPPVMAATFVIEITLAIYTYWRYKMSAAVRLIIIMLVLLATFQAAEYFVCGGFGLSGFDWSRLGFVAITLLPPVGIHLAHLIAKSSKKQIVMLAYASAMIFVVYFAFASESVGHGQCLGNYVMFGISGTMTAIYTLYYYGWLLAGIVTCWRLSDTARSDQQKGALRALATGYVAFLLPTTTVNLIDKQTLSGIPSIMCGFAVLLAIILCGWVLPKVAKKKLP